MKLDDLARKHGTDKWEAAHSFLGESFLDIYERYFEAIRHSPINLLELGVKGGGSLRMWKEYFTKAQVFGIDVNPECAHHRAEGIEILIASQDDHEALVRLARLVGGFDVIIDDASHINVLTVASFRSLFPWLRPGGLYAIEDVGMSWIDLSQRVDNPAFMDGEALANQARGVDIRQNRETLDEHLSGLLYDLDMQRGEVRFVHYWSNLIILQKAASKQEGGVRSGKSDSR